MKFKIQLRNQTVDEYQFLRNTTDWSAIDNDIVKKSLENNLFSICVFKNQKIIGMGRVIGDGYMYFYIQDIIVDPNFKSKGVGKIIMKEIESYLNQNATRGSFIGLMAAKGVTEFYKKFGYLERSKEGPGMFKYLS